MRPGILRWVALAMVLALTAAACGDSGEGDGNGGDGGVTTTVSSGDRTTTTDDGGDDPLSTLGTIGDIPGIGGECEALVEVIFGLSQLFIGSPASANELFASAADRLPSDLRDDIALIAEAAEEYTGLLEDLDIDLINDPTSLTELTPEQQQQFAEAADAFSTPEVEAAFDNLEQYADRECEGFDLTN